MAITLSTIKVQILFAAFRGGQWLASKSMAGITAELHRWEAPQ